MYSIHVYMIEPQLPWLQTAIYHTGLDVTMDMYRTHRVAVSHSLDLVVVLTLGQSVQPLWVELTTRGVELLAVVHRQFSAE